MYRSEEKLPQKVQELPAAGKKLWMEVFNSAFRYAEKKGWKKARREGYAFEVAWKKVKEVYEKKTTESGWQEKQVTEEKEMQTNKNTVEKTISFGKVDDEKQLVYGIVYEPDIDDAQDEWASAIAIEKAAHDFLAYYNQMGLMHKELINEKAKIVESYIAPVDFKLGDSEVKKGSWLISSHIIDKDLWQEVKDGTITGFSMGGYGKRIVLQEEDK